MNERLRVSAANTGTYAFNQVANTDKNKPALNPSDPVLAATLTEFPLFIAYSGDP